MEQNDPLYPKQFDPLTSPEEFEPAEPVIPVNPIAAPEPRNYRPAKTKHLELYCTRSDLVGRNYGILTATDSYKLQTFRHSFEHEAHPADVTTLDVVCPHCGDELEFRVKPFNRTLRELGGEAARDRVLGWALFAISSVLLAFGIYAIRGSGGWMVLLAFPGGILLGVALLILFLGGPRADWDALRFWQLHYELRKSKRGDHQHLIGPADSPLL